MKKLQGIILVVAIVIAAAGIFALHTDEAVASLKPCDQVDCNTALANCQSNPTTYCPGKCTWAGQSRWICPQALCGNGNSNPWCVY